MRMRYPQPSNEVIQNWRHTESNHPSPTTTAWLLNLTMHDDIMLIDHNNPYYSNLARITLVHNESISTQWSQEF